MKSRLSRRDFLQTAAALALTSGCGRSAGPSLGSGGLERMIVLGVDGMDPGLLRRFIAEGRMPNCARLLQSGSFQPLATSNPPQSPVAWSNFISGTNPGGHGIFDFIARDPATMQPFHATTRLEPAGSPLRLGRSVIPLSAGSIQNRRQGPTFWDDLQQHGVDCTVFRMPANFPPTDGEATTLAGMGTPDLQGGYGTFTWFSDDPQTRTRDVSGGRIERVTVREHAVTCMLRGPINDFSADRERVEVPMTVSRDPDRPVVKIVVQGRSVVLNEGEWSDWIVVRFPLLPFAVEVSGICRVYLKSVREPFGLYVSPVNIDPANPSVPLSTPPDYSRRLVRELGYFYTRSVFAADCRISRARRRYSSPNRACPGASDSCRYASPKFRSRSTGDTSSAGVSSTSSPRRLGRLVRSVLGVNADPMVREGEMRNFGRPPRHVAGDAIVRGLLGSSRRLGNAARLLRVAGQAFLAVERLGVGRRGLAVRIVTRGAGQRLTRFPTPAEAHLLDMPHDIHPALRGFQTVMGHEIGQVVPGMELLEPPSASLDGRRTVQMTLGAQILPPPPVEPRWIDNG
jgi:hypothetical protein